MDDDVAYQAWLEGPHSAWRGCLVYCGIPGHDTDRGAFADRYGHASHVMRLKTTRPHVCSVMEWLGSAPDDPREGSTATAPTDACRDEAGDCTGSCAAPLFVYPACEECGDPDSATCTYYGPSGTARVCRTCDIELITRGRDPVTAEQLRARRDRAEEAE